MTCNGISSFPVRLPVSDLRSHHMSLWSIRRDTFAKFPHFQLVAELTVFSLVQSESTSNVEIRRGLTRGFTGREDAFSESLSVLLAF
jgi:hypothetical protein